jgi:chromate reductase, NAD(P)H dehydrogenase (quinone)
VQYD